jgi:hypothetical protein
VPGMRTIAGERWSSVPDVPNVMKPRIHHVLAC